MSLPTITVIGLIQKIETRATQGGKNVTTINLSAGEKNAKGNYENLYIKADFWDKQSDFVSQYFKEGDAIIVTGKLVTTNYEKQDGTKVYETKFLFPSASFVPKPREQTQSPTHPNPPPQQVQAPSQQGAIPTIDISEENIPFAPLDWRL